MEGSFPTPPKIAENLVQETLHFRYLKFLMSIAENPMTQMEIPSADGSCTKAQAGDNGGWSPER